MKPKRMSHEGLKCVACTAMLIDHIAVIFLPGSCLRILGRVAMPLYCFLLAEGMRRTGSRKRYGLRLALGAVLAEVPYDLLFCGRLTWQRQSVMVTLLVGFAALWLMESCESRWLKSIIWIPFLLLADLLHGDYGAQGIMMILVFALLPERKWLWLQAVLLALIGLAMGGMTADLFGISVPIQIFAASAVIPIGLYGGEKRIRSKTLQWGCYLFYPVHLALLLLLK